MICGCSFTFCRGHGALPAAKPAEPSCCCSSGGGAEQVAPVATFSMCQNHCYATRVACPVLIRAELQHSETRSDRVVGAVVPVISAGAARSLLAQHWRAPAAEVSLLFPRVWSVFSWVGRVLRPECCCSDCISTGPGVTACLCQVLQQAEIHPAAHLLCF